MRPKQAPDLPSAEVFGALATPRPGHLGLYRWLPHVWDPGQECLERQRLEKFLRAEGWTLVSEVSIGEPIVGVFYLFRRVASMAIG